MTEHQSWKEEKKSAHLYKLISAKEESPRKELFLKLAQEAEKQAQIWAEKIKNKGEKFTDFFSPDLRTRFVAKLIHRFDPKHLKIILSAMKIRGMSIYSKAEPGHPLPKNIHEVGRRHKSVSTGGNLRAAVFGINDGLVSNASLIFGVAGASHDPLIILLTGIAGLLAGAFSMAAGEFISVSSQREMFEHQIDLEKEELAEYPAQEAEELALIYEAKGLPRDDAKSLATKLISDPARALDTLAREELGLNMEELGSPWGAAIYSCFSFAAGAFIPLVPFIFSVTSLALQVSVICTAFSLFGVGALLSLFTGKQAVKSGFRMLLIGGVAGIATFFIGKLLGVTLGG